MIHKKITILFLATSLFIVGCANGNFEIKKGKVGQITTKTTMNDLAQLFANDSIVKNLSEGATGYNYLQDDDEYLIFEKGGKHLLTIVPKEQLDSTSTIKSIEIFDSRYATEDGLSLNSSFSEDTILKAQKSLEKDFQPIDDMRASKDYRVEIAKNLLTKCFAEIKKIKLISLSY